MLSGRSKLYSVGSCIPEVHQPAGAKVPADTAKQDEAVVEILFATLTNVNFDEERFKEYLKLLIAYRDAYPKIPGEPKEYAWSRNSRRRLFTSKAVSVFLQLRTTTNGHCSPCCCSN
ncbi:MAG: hypothetical protein MJ014_02245 [Methanocorpusculum sp.]|nr:hypothetical protein [Methanocorpusculum sp.]